MFGSLIFYAGLLVVVTAGVVAIRPPHACHRCSRRRALAVAAGGALGAATGLFLPAAESRTAASATHLDRFVPAWQFREFHTRRIAAPPGEVYAALRRVRADDILLFQTLTWIRRGGRALPEGILDAGRERPIIDVALAGGFVLLADDAPRELLVGAIVGTPDGVPRKASAEVIRQPPPGYSVAAMNFLVAADGKGGSMVSTETRVLSNGPAARRKFAKYWRVIYPGSALIRRMWLRAIERHSGARESGLTPV